MKFHCISLQNTPKFSSLNVNQIAYNSINMQLGQGSDNQGLQRSQWKIALGQLESVVSLSHGLLITNRLAQIYAWVGNMAPRRRRKQDPMCKWFSSLCLHYIWKYPIGSVKPELVREGITESRKEKHMNKWDSHVNQFSAATTVWPNEVLATG